MHFLRQASTGGMTLLRLQVLTVSLFSGLTSIMPLSRDWQSGGMKWGMWNTPLFTFSKSWRKLSWSKGRAPCKEKNHQKNRERECNSLNVKANFKWSNSPLGKTHHQESKEDDSTAPHVCSPTIVFLSLVKKNQINSYLISQISTISVDNVYNLFYNLYNLNNLIIY